jgi:hypothetical protein
MSLKTDVPLDGCVVHVITHQLDSGDPITHRYLAGESWEWLDYCTNELISATQQHAWGCDPQSCAAAVLRYKRRDQDDPNPSY